MLDLYILIVCLVVLITASYVDIKILEVPDWLNYAGIAAGLGIHTIFSLQQWNYWPIASSLIGLGIGAAIACLMFYTAQWGGGDAKLLMAMGALIGFEPDKLSFGASFLINLVFVGGVWGILWSAGLATKHAKKFWRTAKSLLGLKKFIKLRIMTVCTALIFIVTAFMIKEFQLPLFGLALITYGLCYLTIFIKAVELCCMHKWITPDKLVEGDWLMHDVKVGKVHVKSVKLGLETKEVNLLKKLYKEKKIGKICVKYGVPFTPAFLVSFLVTLSVGNLVFWALF